MIVVLSGEIATGKSTLASRLADELAAEHLSTGRILQARNREGKQAEGDRADHATDYRWVANAIHTTHTVVDAARRREHVLRIREAFPTRRVFHIHLTASQEAKAARYARRGEETTHAQAQTSETEQQVSSLQSIADLTIDTSRCQSSEAALRALALVRPPTRDRLVDVLVGGQYGSEGKGHVVSHICERGEYKMLVRVGGPNAGHTVLRPHDSKPVAFYHLPSGSLHCDAPIVIGPGACINPEIFLEEMKYLGPDAWKRISIDPQANIIDRSDVGDEGRLVGNIGSTGQGVGYATANKITQRGEGRFLAKDCDELADMIEPTLGLLDRAYRRGHRVLLEGTQGTGLSLHHGEYPYVTSRDTTVSGTAGEAGIPAGRINKSIVVMRTNPIRVASPEGGTSGPMGTDLTWEDVSTRAGIPADTLRERERTTTTKRLRRIAEFNWHHLQRAVMLNAPTDIALTFVDYVAHANRDARRYDQLTSETRRFIEEIERFSATPVSLVTTRFHRRSIIDRRSWL